jgi:hypothetical protein
MSILDSGDYKEHVEYWFEVSEERNKIFWPIEDVLPQNIKEAFDKTFTKWLLMSQGYKASNDIDSCGLCDVYYSDRCDDCPIWLDTGRKYCAETPYEELAKAIEELDEDEDDVEDVLYWFILKEINYLCRVAREYFDEKEITTC